MAGQQQPARAQDPAHLGHGQAGVRDGTQRERADHGVKGGVGERQRQGIGLAQVHRAAELSGIGEQGGAEVDTGQPDRDLENALFLYR